MRTTPCLQPTAQRYVKYGWGNHSNRPVPVYYHGNNTISAGTGNDTVYVGSGIDKFILDTGVGAVTIYNFSSDDSISRGAGLTATDALTLSISGDDTLVSVGADLLATLKSVQLDTVSIV